MKKISLLAVLLVLSAGIVNAQKGKDGAAIINSVNTTANEYTALTADASTGASFIKVVNSALDSDNRFRNPLSQGDLIMIIQVQGATINSSTNDSTWGAVTNYNNCGLYEFSQVASVPDSVTINLGCPLKNNYTAAGKVQVVRVPRYSSLTINSGDSLTCDPWNGSTGGIVSVEVSGNTLINSGGAINVSGQGFRGGTLYNTNDVYIGLVTDYRSENTDSGGMRGEGIAGYQADYNAFGGWNCRGAAANGGGGGNDHNAGGGGGANAGITGNWTGEGNPSLTDTDWADAWNLEYPGFANTTSSGGGRGGYTYSGSTANPLTTPPGSAAWGGDNRENIGGNGGRPLDYSGGRLFFGGGGGAGHENNDVGGPGTSGGGLIFILSYDSISGSGAIIANGADGGNTDPSYGRDGAGGAGGGGTVVLSSAGAISGISISANGGAGGNQYIYTDEAEGPGGGGGGYIAISNGNVTRTANGGASGTTNCPAFTLFPPNGATGGGGGMPDEGFSPISISISSVTVGPNVSICPGSSAPLSASGASSYNWSPATGLSCDTCANPVANPAVTTTYSLTGGCASEADSVVVTVFSVQPPVLTTTDSIFCASDSTLITASRGYNTYLWNTGDTTSFIYAENAGGYWVSVTDANGCSAISPHQNIRVYPVPSVSIVVDGEALSSFDATSYQWYYDGSIIDGATSPYYIAEKSGDYSIQITDSNGCTTLSNEEYVAATGISELSGNGSINIYPNPFNSVVFISNSDADDYLEEMKIYDALGQQVLNKIFSKTTGVTETIDVSILPPGVYFMNIKSEKISYSRLLIKE